MFRTVDTVERERERAISKEISFFRDAKNIEIAGAEKLEGIEKNKTIIKEKDRICSKEKLLHSLSFFCV